MEVRRMVRSDMQAGGEGWRAMMELGHLAD